MTDRRPDGRGITRRELLVGSAASGVAGAAGFAAGRADRGDADEVQLHTGERTTTTALRRAVQPDGVFRVDTTAPVVGLSFDDGPDPAFTPSVLEVLAEKGAKATFFVVGANALAHRELLAEVVAAGHSIGNHTYDHGALETMPPDAVAREIERGEQAIVDAGAPRPTLFRPPRGFTDEVVGIFADAERYRTIFWTLAVEHYVLHEGLARAVDQMLARIRPGDIVLAHDGGHLEVPGAAALDRSTTVAALPLLLDGLARRKLQVLDIPGLLTHERRRQFRLTDR
jgi:chitooligosaccharide deacetylase